MRATTQQIPFVDLKRQYRQHRSEWLGALTRVAESGRYIGGEEVAAFEKEFAHYCGTAFAVGTGSGSDALRLALLALKIGPGDEVVTVSHTFVATVDAIVHVGATPVFVDIDPVTYTLDPKQLKAALGPRVKAVLPVHLYGLSADMAPILETCEAAAVPVLEDAAQAHGATYQGRACGSMGKAACFSFYPSKNLGAFGDAGIVATSDGELADQLRLLRQYGEAEKYNHKIVGFNSRLDALQAAVLRTKLPHLDAWNERRREIAALYDATLGEIPGIGTPTTPEGRRHIYHIYGIRAQRRYALQQFLTNRGVEVGIHYPTPVHRQPSYREIRTRSLDLSATVAVAKQELSLPMFPELTRPEVETVCRLISDWAQPR